VKHWFAIRTHPRAEKVVRDHLERKALEFFLPTITKWSRWKDRKKAVEWPLFAGYCFARFDPRNELAVLSCPRVANVVSFGAERAPIPDIEIESLRTLVRSDLAFDPVPFIKEGMVVEVIHGPLKGATGRLIRKGSNARLVLAVDIIAQAVSVQVDASDVRPY
jgi:transcription antitermination factor NusG